jgi:hypothetical protein
MRRARVPVLSLYPHDLVSDPGGRHPVSPRATRRIRRSRARRRSAVPTPMVQGSWGGIPCGTTTCKHLSRRHTDPADWLHPASDVGFLPPAGVATRPVARRCPGEALHLLDNRNRFHRGCRPRIPTVTSFARRDSAVLGVSAAAPPHIWEELGQCPALGVILFWSPRVVVTVRSLVLRARMLGWSRERATTSLVTGPVLIPFGRLLYLRCSRARGLVRLLILG